MTEFGNHWSWTVRWFLISRLSGGGLFWEYGAVTRSKRISFTFSGGIFKIVTSRLLSTSMFSSVEFFFNIEDYYIFASRVGIQLDISFFEGFDILIKGFNVLEFNGIINDLITTHCTRQSANLPVFYRCLSIREETTGQGHVRSEERKLNGNFLQTRSVSIYFETMRKG